MSTEVKTLGDMAADSAARDKQPGRPGEPVSADRQIAAYFERLEKERLARRAEIRRQIAERDKLMVRVSDLEAQLRELDKRADQAAEKHAAAAEPIQRKLESASGTQRTKLLSELTTVNLDLERELEGIGRTRNPLIREHRETRSSAAALPTENRLAGADLASPKLLAEKHAGECRLRMAQARVEHARDQLEVLEPRLEMVSCTKLPVSQFGHTAINKPPQIDFEQLAHLRRRVAWCRCELTHAAAEMHAAQQALAEIAAAMRAE